MRIGIEAQRIFRKNKHGMDYVVLQEIKELQQMDTKNEYFVFVAPGEDHCLEDTKNVHIIEIGGNFYPIWEQITLPNAAKELKVDILHCTSNTAPIFCNIPLILTLHDITFLEVSLIILVQAVLVLWVPVWAWDLLQEEFLTEWHNRCLPL